MVSIYLTWRNMVRKNFSIFPTLDMHDYGSDCFNVKCAWLERDDDTFDASDCFSVKYAWLEREDDTLDTSVKYLCKTFVIQFLLKKQWTVYFYFFSFIHGFDNGPRRGWVEAKKTGQACGVTVRAGWWVPVETGSTVATCSRTAEGEKPTSIIGIYDSW